ncbi:hypothetical protein CCAN11_1000013 [Capnocytophaga canimorsus]|uniref:Uncharacterized protein n=1 Tax=Capnocytophaga canimorsus TaxID=28188 RepID=A0A0B7I6A0_9FLAO|nr:hypothetical protein CCAN11_1000013 [Capnocytophaga canimorsus]
MTNRPITVITNGYDVQNQPKAKVSDRFLISPYRLITIG